MTVEVHTRDGVAVVTLARPDKKNAITMDMRCQLFETFEGFRENDEVRAVVLTGAGGDFCSGMDVGEFGSRDVRSTLHRMERLHRISRAIYSLKKPTIAAVSGVCMGVGWSYALSCDMVIASPTARFAQVFNKTALAPDGGASWLLARNVGLMRAKEITYSGRFIGAEEALTLNLILELVSDAPVLDRALDLARGFAKGPALALEMAKRQYELAASTDFCSFLENEASMQPLLMRSDDYLEGVSAFGERRPPQFRGT
jgi:2-(1,2-epoxy-1,2-dihydrophenyl)acetyl-CoA isomerase